MVQQLAQVHEMHGEENSASVAVVPDQLRRAGCAAWALAGTGYALSMLTIQVMPNLSST